MIWWKALCIKEQIKPWIKRHCDTVHPHTTSTNSLRAVPVPKGPCRCLSRRGSALRGGRPGMNRKPRVTSANLGHGLAVWLALGRRGPAWKPVRTLPLWRNVVNAGLLILIALHGTEWAPPKRRKKEKNFLLLLLMLSVFSLFWYHCYHQHRH